MQTLLLTQLSGVLENAVFTKINALGLNIPNATLKAIVSRVAEITASTVVQDVNKNANFQLNEIPKNLIGPINPVNILSGNNSSNDITNNLNGLLQVQLSSQITDKVVVLLQNELTAVLPKDKLNLINFPALAATLVQLLTPSIGKSITTALSSFSDSLFSRGQTATPVVSSIDQAFSTLSSDDALAAVDQQFADNIAGQALFEAKNFDVNSAENQEKLVVVEKGFTDPTANYPTKEYAGLTETNKLATGDVAGTIIQEKNNDRLIGAKLPGGEAWDQPESPYRAQYPYNKVTQTESGHIIEVDDTHGSERIHIYHKSGTFVEIDANGSMVKRTKGSSYEIIDRNGKISIAGRADISISGACNIFVGNDANIEVEGDVNLTCHNDITAMAGGTLNLSATEEVNITGNKVNIQAYQDMNLKSNVDLRLFSEEMHFKANVDLYASATTLYQNTSTSYHQTGSSLYEKVGGSRFTEVEGAIHNKAGGDINNDGDNFYMNSGTSSGSQPSKAANDAAISNIGIMSGRKDIVKVDINDPQAMTLADNRSILLEEEAQTPEEYTKQKNVIISEGYANSAGIEATPVPIDSADVQSTQRNLVEPDVKLKSITALPGNYNLSPNFTLEMLSNKAAVTRDSIVAHSGLTYGELVYNLQAVALNVLEPVKKLYPNMFVTSAFRNPGNASNAKTSQHPKGQGVDIQFKGATKAEYYEIAIKLAKVLKYDQLILEFCNYTKNPWIHVSYSVEKNRTQVLTFFNHRKHSDGLTQLA
jgi:uncharacterized protein YcbK (DUF882 family)